ncbi:hypothetical protein I3760_16G056200 [Carya illinoinensis]|nr:hypothetical protein I3760_16G056200 [Carya illinoinensis]
MEILSSIIVKIGEYLVLPIGEQFGYLISYKSSIMILQEKFSKLREKKEAVQQSVDGALWNQEVVPSEVNTWLTNVGERIEEVQKFLEEDVKTNKMCMNGWCPNMKIRYSLGKKAQKNTRAIVELLEEGGKYDKVFNISPPLKVRSSTTERFKDFRSRQAMIRNVLEALRDEKIDMIAICGMGGIGKTEMAKEIARRVKADDLFHEVAIAVVSQSPNLTKIQGELAEMLGARLNAESLQGRANELYSRLTKSKSVLVILDDVWDPLDLEVVGVYHALKEKSCKILLTSRSEETCNQMRFQKIFRIGLLSKEEAWNFFREMAGDCINAPNLISIAKQVVRECACLPIAIVTVGSALRNKRDEFEWKAALHQLKMSIPQNIPGLHPKVYSSIEFSYNYLGSDEAKSCLLLCCLYPEDYDVPIEHLVRYGVAKRFLKGFSIVEQIRAHVNTIVRNLQRSNLLLVSKSIECVKMHDIVRDVAISIASRDEHGFMVELDRRHEEWPQKDTYDSYTTISLLLGEMKGHLDGLKCPKLQLLRLSCLKDSEILLGNLFNGMNELRMLSLQEGCFSLNSLPPSIQILENLRMLNLESCRLRDVSAIGSLGKLEILSFHDSKIEELPWKIGNLSQLKLLDMKGCNYLKRIAAGVLSNLFRLQELYMPRFKNWKCTTTMEGNGEGTSNNASLAELIPYFGQMTVLEISVLSIGCLPKELHFSNSSLRFRINTEDDGRYLFENEISLEGEDANDLGKILEMVISRGVFGNQIHCRIVKCKRSESIFWLAMVRDLVQLKSLEVLHCEKIQELFSEEGEDKEKVIGDAITLPKMEKIRLSSLPRLIGISKSMNLVEVEGGGNTSSTTLSHKLFSSNTIFWFPNLKFLEVDDCGSLEVIFDLEGLKVIEKCQPILALSQLTSLHFRLLDEMAHVWKNIPRGFQGFQKLKSIKIWKCCNLRSLFPFSVAKLLVHLQKVQISFCQLMENIIEREDEGGDERKADIIVFPQIQTFHLHGLENLVSFSSEAHSFEWPSIEEIALFNCPKLKTFDSEVQSEKKLRKKDTKLDARAPQVPSAGSSSTRESFRFFNQCLELSGVRRHRSYNPDQGYCSSTSGESKHNLNKEVTLTNQDELENQTKMCSLFPYNLIESLENLKKLLASKCDSLEVIFELEGLNVEESNIFNNLAKLSLKTLPKVLNIWKKGPRDIKGFNNLRLLKVWGCDSLKCLFTLSIAKLLVKLEKIEVHYCNQMEEILAKESGDEKKRDVITFPQVKTLSLRGLPKLECFCNEAIAFEWPSLEKMTIVGCEKLKMFVSTSMQTPKLKGVHTGSETFQPMIEGDLNTTIQHIIKRKANLQEISQSSRSP